ncbi:hypothetical protein B0H10DRAFT_613833 [Mycena sp. CBHHK59/15]|nr:hypothetical protein B0H10DRAFT_613833 [Mycena sp. CBHHK59/15]
MQRQVDADEEAEQKRLEEEIAASRLARLRRSRGLGSGSKTNSLDLSKSKEYSSALRTDDTTSGGDAKPPADRHKGQADALNKLVGSTSPPPATARPSVASSANQPQSMSLAAFMGGKATGPRLNRHAPQQDAHDPTQFVQRTRIDAPHPIFGRGGVAMPGMSSRSPASRQVEQPEAPSWSRTGHTPEPRGRRLSTPSPEKLEIRPISPTRISVRERTISTPSGTVVPKNGPVLAPQPNREPPSQSFLSENRPKTSHTSTRSSNTSPISGVSRTFTPRQSHPPSTPPPPKSPPTKSPITTPSLVRPIQPEPRASPHGPQISLSQTPSPAFLRPPPQKDPTPSLSRLQGRGFVQNMVKVSSQLDSSTSSPSNPTPEKNRPTSGRKSSVLDRWPGSNVSPPASPNPIPVRRSKTVEPTTPVGSPSVKSGQMSKSYSDNGKARQDESNAPGERVPGLGSASTMVIIQPKVPNIDEHGFKRGDEPATRLPKASTVSEPTKPLIHPTRDRARKPKKNNIQASESVERDPAPSISGPPTPAVTTPASNSGMVGRRALPGMAQPDSTNVVSSKPVYDLVSLSESIPASNNGMVGRRALPGMAQPDSTNVVSSKPVYDLVSLSESIPAPRALPGLAAAGTPRVLQKDNLSSPTPGVHTQIPSTGNRPTVMDVAQALADQLRALSPNPPVPPRADSKLAESNNSPAVRPRNITPPSVQSEKRKSSYERYSVMLPPLKEEATPDPTPVSTLSRAVGHSITQPDFDLVASMLSEEAGKVVEEPEEAAGHKNSSVSDMLHLTHIDEPLPRVDVSALISETSTPGPDSDVQTIQVDVLAIAGSNASPLGLTHIFYDTEILAIIHRSKSRSSGLINSTVWSWKGKNGDLGSSEERKLAELAKRYGTSIVPIQQLSEPVELVRCLGGTLTIRQESRAHWANENTAMHIVRSMDGVIYIDQVDIDIKNLCSGFSYCISILDTLFVWHGCGSTPEERKAASEYGQTLTSNPDNVVVLTEGENDDDEMFWMVLGEEAEYAKADYWKWRPSIGISPRIWSVDANRKDPISPVLSFSKESLPYTSVYIIDCVFELFVLVASGARGKRRNITLALTVATDLATHISSARPYTPTVHAVILPSQLPVDLKIQLRDLDQFTLNNCEVPGHMNILSYKEALAHLQTSLWSRSQLKDKTMLPLGLDESQVS